MEATTSFTPQILSAHPHPSATGDALGACIEACFACAQACVSCADACLGEERLEHLRGCIRLNLDCADICATTGRALSRQTEPEPMLLAELVRVCALACTLCADECAHHGDTMEHCRVCADACRACERACQALAADGRQVT